MFCVPQVDLQKETLINFLSLEVSLCVGLSPECCRVNKRLRVGGREKEVERTGCRGQDRRQEEGIPSPSLHLDDEGTEGTPLPFSLNIL